MTRSGGRRRPGRPRTIPSSAADPRAEILEHAAALFSRKGIEATRITDIAAQVGVSAPTIYHYFENLDAIVEELLDYVVSESVVFAVHEAEGSGPCADRLTALLESHIRRLTTGPYDLWFVARLADAEAQRFPTITRRANEWRDAVVRLVAQGVERGELAPVDPGFAQSMASGMVYGALELRHAGTPIDPTEVARFITRSLLP